MTTTGRALSLVAAAALLAGCATAAATPGAKIAGTAPDLTAGSACLKALPVVADVKKAMTVLESRTTKLDRALTRLEKDGAALRAIAAATTDATAPEAVQDVADAISAYIAGSTGASSERSSDVGATARAALAGFLTVCPVADGGFESGSSGWTATGGTLSRVAGGRSGAWAGQLTSTGTGTSAVVSAPAVGTRARTSYDVGVWLRTDGPPVTATLQVVERRSGSTVASAAKSVTVTSSWQPVAVRYKVRSPGSSLELQLSLTGLATGQALVLDDFWALHH